MRHAKALVSLAALPLLFSSPARPEGTDSAAVPPPEVNAFAANTEVLDVPTGSTMFGRMFGLNLRMYRGGGVMLKAAASWKNTLMGGFSTLANNLIGSGKIDFPDDPPVRAFVKFRFLNNPKMGLQAAFGWDDSSYDVMRGRGLFAVVSRDLSVSGFYLTAHGGLGMVHLRDYKSDRDTNAFVGISGSLSEDFTVGLEWDDFLYEPTKGEIADNPMLAQIKHGSCNAVAGFAWDVGLRIELGFKNLFKGVAAHHRIAKIVYTF